MVYIYINLKIIFLHYTCDFETIGSLTTDEIEKETNIRFKNFDDFETYINAIDVDYISEEVF